MHDKLTFYEAIEIQASHECVKLNLEICTSTIEFNLKHISEGTFMNYVTQLGKKLSVTMAYPLNLSSYLTFR